jgi:hypothetical protein
MRQFLTILIVLGGFISCAQKQEIKLESKMLPNHVYKMTLSTESESEIDFEGTKEQLDNIKANGIKLPIKTENESEFITTTTTYALNKDQSFEAIMEYGDIESIDKTNGIENKTLSPISGLKIKGVYGSDNKFRIDTMISETVDENLKMSLKASIEGLQSQIKFPDTPMKIGESFDQEMPMSIPIAGLSPVNLVINTNYKLIKILDNTAYFDISQTVNLGVNSEQFKVEASGEGKGKSELDIEKMYLTKNTTNLEMRLSVYISSLLVKAKIKSISGQNVEILKN